MTSDRVALLRWFLAVYACSCRRRLRYGSLGVVALEADATDGIEITSALWARVFQRGLFVAMNSKGPQVSLSLAWISRRSSVDADGSGPAEILIKRPFDQFPYSILADGTLLFVEIHPRTGRDLWTASPDGKVSPLRVTPSNEFNAHFSPGPMGAPRSVAYSSDESGRSEIYMQSFPGGERRVAVSTSGGILPAWSPDGKELFYVTGEAMMAAAMQPDGSVGASRRLFDRSGFLLNDRFRSYAVSPDGKRFLMLRRDPGSIPSQLNVILNWTAESKQTAARGGGN